LLVARSVVQSLRQPANHSVGHSVSQSSAQPGICSAIRSFTYLVTTSFTHLLILTYIHSFNQPVVGPWQPQKWSIANPY